MKAQAVDPDAARNAAHHILSDRRFRHDPAPRPLRGPLEWIGDRLRGIVNWLGDVLSHVPTNLLLLIGIAAVAGVIAYVVAAVKRRRVTARPSSASATPAKDGTEDARTLERTADEAERDGDLERALRLRFRAGLLRLGDRGAIKYRPSVTTDEVRRALDSHTFEHLARTFEEVTYGDRVAEKPDVDTARREWPQVLEQAGRS